MIKKVKARTTGRISKETIKELHLQNLIFSLEREENLTRKKKIGLILFESEAFHNENKNKIDQRYRKLKSYARQQNCYLFSISFGIISVVISRTIFSTLPCLFWGERSKVRFRKHNQKRSSLYFFFSISFWISRCIEKNYLTLRLRIFVIST